MSNHPTDQLTFLSLPNPNNELAELVVETYSDWDNAEGFGGADQIILLEPLGVFVEKKREEEFTKHLSQFAKYAKECLST